MLSIWSGESIIANPFKRLTVILTLRYLNVRVLLHRQVLVKFLGLIRNNYQPTSLLDKQLLTQFGIGSLQACLESASNIISIIYRTGKRSNLLGAWWFSSYYSKCTVILHSVDQQDTNAKPVIAFNASLIVISGLVIHGSSHLSNFGSMLPWDSLRENLNLADEALENVGGGVRLVERCRKYLQALIRITKGSGIFKTHV